MASLNRVGPNYNSPLLALLIFGRLRLSASVNCGQPVPGEALRLEVAFDRCLTGSASMLPVSSPDTGQPGDDLPWLAQGLVSSVRTAGEGTFGFVPTRRCANRGSQMRIQIGCGHEISREYILMGLAGTRTYRATPFARRIRSRNGWPMSTLRVWPPARVRPAPQPDAVPALRLKPRQGSRTFQSCPHPGSDCFVGGDATGEPSLAPGR